MRLAPAIKILERSKTIRALDVVATMIGVTLLLFRVIRNLLLWLWDLLIRTITWEGADGASFRITKYHSTPQMCITFITKPCDVE
jgi:hypothetical protein